MRRPTLDESNQIFTAAVLGLGGVIGSTISFLFGGAILAAFLRLLQDVIAYPTDRKVHLITAAFAGYFASACLSGLLNYEGVATLLQIAEKLPFLAFIFIYARLSLSPRRHVLRATEIGVIVGSLGAFAFALIQAVGMGLRAEGLAGNPGPFALITALLYGLSTMTIMRRRGRMRLLATAAAISAAGALILSGMRSLWPMLLLAPALQLMVLRPIFSRRSIGQGIVAAGALVLVVGAAGYETIQTRFGNLMHDYQEVVVQEDFDNSLGLRLIMWSEGLEQAAQKPVFGQGLKEVEISLPPQSSSETGQELTFNHYHNFVVDALARTGLVGLLATLLMMFAPAWIATRQTRDDLADAGRMMMFTVLLAYFLSGAFNIMLGHDILDVLFIYSMIVSTFLVLDQSDGETLVPYRTEGAQGSRTLRGDRGQLVDRL